jgi:glycosyltransferase involved in cell wall biosynthesis
MTNSTKPLEPSTGRTIKEELGLVNQRVLLFNGGLSDVRNLQKFIEIFDLAAPPNWKFVIIGYWASESLMDCIQKSDRTIIIDPESNITLLNRIRDVDAIVAPYPPVDKNTKYCFPNKMGDAIAIRKPIIVNSELEFLNRLSRSYKFIIPFTYGDQEIQSLRVALESTIEREFEWDQFEEELGWISFERVFSQIVERLKKNES